MRRRRWKVYYVLWAEAIILIVMACATIGSLLSVVCGFASVIAALAGFIALIREVGM